MSLDLQAKELLDKTKVYANKAIEKLEESRFVEIALNKYENLEPRYQKRIRSGIILFICLSLVLFLLIPLWAVSSKRTHVSLFESLVQDIRQFNSISNVVREKAPPPQGWSTMHASSIEDMEGALNKYLADIGVDPNFLEVKVNSADSSVQINADEITIKQLISILFQMDGWYPVVKVENSKMSIASKSKDLVNLQLKLKFQGGTMGQSSDSDSSSDFDSSFGGDDTLPPGNVDHGNSSPPSGGSRSDAFDSSNNGNDPFRPDDFSPPGGGGPSAYPPPPNLPDDNFLDPDLPPPTFLEE